LESELSSLQFDSTWSNLTSLVLAVGVTFKLCKASDHATAIASHFYHFVRIPGKARSNNTARMQPC
jgi:hypothetical protein